MAQDERKHIKPYQHIPNDFEAFAGEYVQFMLPRYIFRKLYINHTYNPLTNGN